VDPKCEVSDEVHVFIEDRTPWQALLTRADLISGANSYYKLQLLKHDKHDMYYLFRSWGRIGTTVGGSKTEDFHDDLHGAQELFCK
jgi:poly [ADP-ribose] polymerase